MTRAPATGRVWAPSAEDVADGRYVRPVQATGLRISPPASSATLGLNWVKARTLFESVTTISGMHAHAILGRAEVTLTGIRLPTGTPTLLERPAWVGITWGGTVNCPAETVPPKSTPTTTPPPNKPIYSAVVIYGPGGNGAVVYTSSGTPACGGGIVRASVASASSEVSIPWKLGSAIHDGSATLTYRAPSCASLDSWGGSGSMKTGKFTITVDVARPFDRAGCGANTTRHIKYRSFPSISPPGAPPRPKHVTLLHGPVGLARTLEVSKVAGES